MPITEESTPERPRRPQVILPKTRRRDWAVWHRLKRHKVGSRTFYVGGFWDGAWITEVTCYTCDLEWRRTTL